MLRVTFPIVVLVLVAGCASPGLLGTGPRDLEVRGWESGSWQKDPGATAPTDGSENFVFYYETVGRRDGKKNPFHRMKTEIRLTYDRKKGVISDAKVKSSEEGGAYRHLTFMPTKRGLWFRVVTHLDDRATDLTVVRLDGPAPSIRYSGGYGVGPWEGLNETFNVVFKDDGTYRLSRATCAHYTEADVHLERTMSTRENASAPSTASFPSM